MAKPQSITEYAIRSLLDIHSPHSFYELTSEMLVEWVASMLLKRTKPSTIRRYWKKLHTLFIGWMENDDVDPFVETREIIDKIHGLEDEDAMRNLSLIPRLFNKNERAPEYQYIAIFFILLYNPTLSLIDIPNLTFDSVERICPQIEEIIDSRDSTFGRKYIFPLRQGKATPARIYRDLTTEIGRLLKIAGFHFFDDFSRESITSIWIAAAMKSGFSPEDIRAIIPAIPREYSPLALVEKKEISASERRRIICEVANSINDNTQRWFVMKLRPGVKPDEVTQRIDSLLPGRSKSMSFFYPTRTLVRKDGKRTIKEEVPYLPDLLFFKTQRLKLKSLFTAIGDLAWGYRLSTAPDAPYTVIPNPQMSLFQRAIGRFTPDIELSLISATPSAPLTSGHRVRITGGLLAGYEGEILDVAPTPSSTPSSPSGDPSSTPSSISDLRTFILRLTTTDAATWQVAIPDIFIEELPS